MGAGFVLSFAAWAAAALLLRLQILRQPGRVLALPTLIRAEAWWWVPALAAAAVVATLASNRLSLPQAEAWMDTGSRTAGHAGPAAVASLRTLALDFAALGRDDGASGFAARWLFVLGFAGCLASLVPSGHGRRWLGHAVAAGLAAAALLSVFGAYYHFGVLCCARHAVVRQGFLALLPTLPLAALLAAGLRAAPRVRRWTAIAAPLLVAAALAVAAAERAPSLRMAFAWRRHAEQARQRTWQSGRQAGVPWMVFVRQPDDAGMPVHGLGVPLGNYRQGMAEPDVLQAMQRFFGKAYVEVCDPWQTDRTWVIDGVAIPACGYGRDTAMSGTQEPGH